jgi:ABC-type nitrate/sulfonate/bicarbonate transport system substrate-binding protein
MDADPDSETSTERTTGESTTGDRQVGRVASRRGFLALAGAGVTTALAGCSGSSAGEGTTTSGTKKTTMEPASLDFQMQWYRNDTGTFAPLTAGEQWTWPEYNLDVTVKESEGSQAAAKAVASKDAPVGQAELGAAIPLIEKGAPIKIIGSYMGPFGGIVYLNETGIESWSDLEGKTIGQYPWGSSGPVAKAAMEEKGVDLSTIEFQNVQPGSARKIQLDGQIDAMIRYVPQELAMFEQQGIEAGAFRSVEVLGHMGNGLLAHEEFIEEHPGQVSRMVAGWLDGVKKWATDYEEVTATHREIVKSESSRKWNAEYHDALRGPMFSAYTPPEEVGTEHGKGWIPMDRMQTTIETFNQAGLIDSKPDAEEIATNEFIEEHNELAVETASALYDQLEEYDVDPTYI